MYLFSLIYPQCRERTVPTFSGGQCLSLDAEMLSMEAEAHGSFYTVHCYDGTSATFAIYRNYHIPRLKSISRPTLFSSKRDASSHWQTNPGEIQRLALDSQTM